MDVQKRKTVDTKEKEEKPLKKTKKTVHKRPLGYTICKVVSLAALVVIAAYFMLAYVFNQFNNDVSNAFYEGDDQAVDEIPHKNPEDISVSTEPTNQVSIEDKLDDAEEDASAIYKKFDQLNHIAMTEKNKEYLEDAIALCTRIVDLSIDRVSKEFHVKVGKECAASQQARGWSSEAVKTFQKLLSLYPDDQHLIYDAGVTALLCNQATESRKYFQQLLSDNKSSYYGFAMAHLGIIKKIIDKDLPGCILLLEEAMKSGSIQQLEEAVDSGHPRMMRGAFFLHLGEAYYRVGKHEKAYKTYEKGAKMGVFLSKWQRSLFNVERLASRPWWTYEETGHADILQKIEENWKIIRDEALAQLNKNGVFHEEDQQLRETGDWKQLVLYRRGEKDDHVCQRVPQTCKLLSDFVDATSCNRGQIKFSVMEGGLHVWPHSGPTNCRIRAHLGLVIPEGPRIRVMNDTRTWQEGKFIIFDDSFEHEVWHDGSSTRLVLIVDIWHPDLTETEKATLTPVG